MVAPMSGGSAAAPQGNDSHPPPPGPSPDELSARLAAIVESSDDAIVSKDLSGTIMSWNPAAERMFGYAAAEVVGKSIRLIIPEARQAEENEVLRRVVAGEAVDHFETVRRRKDGSEIIVSLTVSPVRNADDVIIGASKTARDITERKRESQRAAFFADIGPLLAASRDVESTPANIARLTTIAFAGTTTALADFCVIDLLERDGTLLRVAVAHRIPHKEALLEQLRHHPPDRERGFVTRPLRTGRPLLLARVSDLDIDEMALDAEHTRILRALGPPPLHVLQLLLVEYVLTIRRQRRVLGRVLLVLEQPGGRDGRAAGACAGWRASSSSSVRVSSP